MLTDLSFIATGQQFPPPCESGRMTMYNNNKLLFECEHADVYEEELRRIERVIGNFGEIVSYPVIANYQKLISLKTADLLLGESPKITSSKQTSVDAITDNSDLINLAYQIAIDVSRYGDGLFNIRKVGDKGNIGISQPPIWYPIVSDENAKEIIYHVLAWQTNGKLKVQIHEKGFYTERAFDIDMGTISKEIFSDKDSKGVAYTLPRVIQTGLDDFAVVQVSNVTTSDRCTGYDDYTDIDSIVSDLMVRVGQIDRILDKHASPSMSGPATALERDPVSGEYRLKAGNYFPRESSEEPNVDYITWDGQLEANFKQIEKLTNLLYTISEMGSAIFGDTQTNTGQIASGTALRRLMISPLAKVARIRNHFDSALKKALVLCSQLGGKGVTKLDYKDITIKWQDGLPADDLEVSEILKNRTAGKATMSVKRALTTYDTMSEEDADEEAALIADEEAAAMPLAIPEAARGEESEPIEETI